MEAVPVTTGVGAVAGALEALEAWAKMATMAMVIWCVLEVLLSLSLSFATVGKESRAQGQGQVKSR